MNRERSPFVFTPQMMEVIGEEGSPGFVLFCFVLFCFCLFCCCLVFGFCCILLLLVFFYLYSLLDSPPEFLEFVDLCAKGYISIKKHFYLFLEMFRLMSYAGLPELRSLDDAQYLWKVFFFIHETKQKQKQKQKQN